MTVNIHEAKTQLSALIERALAGEEVVIAKAGRPVVVLSPIAAKPGRALGGGRGLTKEVAGWEKAMTDEEADHFLGLGGVEP